MSVSLGLGNHAELHARFLSESLRVPQLIRNRPRGPSTTCKWLKRATKVGEAGQPASSAQLRGDADSAQARQQR